MEKEERSLVEINSKQLGSLFKLCNVKKFKIILIKQQNRSNLFLHTYRGQQSAVTVLQLSTVPVPAGNQ